MLKAKYTWKIGVNKTFTTLPFKTNFKLNLSAWWFEIYESYDGMELSCLILVLTEVQINIYVQANIDLN